MRTRKRCATLFVALVVSAMEAIAQGTPAASVQPSTGSVNARSAPGMYVADENGVPYQRIATYRADEFPFVLTITSTDGREIRELLSGGKSVRRWETDFSSSCPIRERCYEEGILVEETQYTQAGRIASRRTISKDGTVRHYDFDYDGERVASVRVTDGAGKSIRTDDVLYSKKGFAYTVRRQETIAEKSSPDISFDGESHSVSGSADSWRSKAGEQRVRRTDASGNVVFEATIQAGVVIERIDTKFDGRRPTQRVVETPAERRSVVTAFDNSGRATEETRYLDGAVVGGTTYQYDDRNRIVAVRTTEKNSTEVAEYTYSSTSAILSVRFTVDGELVRIVTYGQNDSRIEELFDKGTLFARVTYEAGRKAREDIITEGSVVKSRIFK